MASWKPETECRWTFPAEGLHPAYREYEPDGDRLEIVVGIHVKGKLELEPIREAWMAILSRYPVLSIRLSKAGNDFIYEPAADYAEHAKSTVILQDPCKDPFLAGFERDVNRDRHVLDIYHDTEAGFWLIIRGPHFLLEAYTIFSMLNDLLDLVQDPSASSTLSPHALPMDMGSYGIPAPTILDHPGQAIRLACKGNPSQGIAMHHYVTEWSEQDSLALMRACKTNHTTVGLVLMGAAALALYGLPLLSDGDFLAAGIARSVRHLVEEPARSEHPCMVQPRLASFEKQDMDHLKSRFERGEIRITDLVFRAVDAALGSNTDLSPDVVGAPNQLFPFLSFLGKLDGRLKRSYGEWTCDRPRFGVISSAPYFAFQACTFENRLTLGVFAAKCYADLTTVSRAFGDFQAILRQAIGFESDSYV